MRYIRKIGFLQILCLMLLINANEYSNQTRERRGVVENIGEGLKFAGQMFGINTAADVANLVAMAFSKTKPSLMTMFQQKPQHQQNNNASEMDASQEKQASMKNEQRQKQYQQQQQQQNNESEGEEEERKPLKKQQEFSTSRFVAGILRMIGFDVSKLGALALNAILVIAEAVGSAFLQPARTNDAYPRPTPLYDSEDESIPEVLSRGNRETHKQRALRQGTPIDWYLENPSKEMRRLLDEALDSQLTEHIVEMIEHIEQQEGGQIGCIKLLMCKSSPIIWGMQRAVSERVTGRIATNTTNTAKEGTDAKESKATKDEAKDEAKEAKEETADSKPVKPKKPFSTEPLFAYFPSFQEFRKYSVKCDERFGAQCNVDAVDDDEKDEDTKELKNTVKKSNASVEKEKEV